MWGRRWWLSSSFLNITTFILFETLQNAYINLTPETLRIDDRMLRLTMLLDPLNQRMPPIPKLPIMQIPVEIIRIYMWVTLYLSKHDNSLWGYWVCWRSGVSEWYTTYYSSGIFCFWGRTASSVGGSMWVVIIWGGCYVSLWRSWSGRWWGGGWGARSARYCGVLGWTSGRGVCWGGGVVYWATTL